MNKYRVKFEETVTGYVDVFADNEDDAICRLIKQPASNSTIETEEIKYEENPELLK